MTDHSKRYDRGGYIPSGDGMVLVIPWSDRGKPLPPGWDPLHVIRADECITNSARRCIRADHPHGSTS